MKIDEKSLAFGYEIKTPGGTPSWGTALGQSEEHKIKDDYSEEMKAMVYSAVQNEKVELPLGKGGQIVKGSDPDSRVVLTSVFSKVFFNGKEIENGKFILVITKEKGTKHDGRLSLKYGPRIRYCDGENKFSNEQFFKELEKTIGISEKGCWFVYEIDFVNQDEIDLKGIIVNPEEKEIYEDNNQLKEKWGNYKSKKYLKNDFIYYLKNVEDKENNKGQLKNYFRPVNELEKLCDVLMKRGELQKDVFLISDTNEYEKAKEIIKQSKEYKESEQKRKENHSKSGSSLTHAINLYEKFLNYRKEKK